MSDFKAKMHQIRFRLGLRPRPRWGSLQRSPRSPSWILRGPTSKGREGGREGEGKGRGKGGKREGEGEGGKGREKGGRRGKEREKGGTPLQLTPLLKNPGYGPDIYILIHQNGSIKRKNTYSTYKNTINKNGGRNKEK